MNVLFKDGSISKRIMQVAFLCGCVSYAQIYLMASSRATVSKTVSKLVKKHYLEDIHVYVGGRKRRILVPTKRAKAELSGTLFEGDLETLNQTAYRLSFKRLGNIEKERNRMNALTNAITTAEQTEFFYSVSTKETGQVNFLDVFEDNFQEAASAPNLVTWERASRLLKVLPHDQGWVSSRVRGYLIGGKYLMAVYSMPVSPIIIRTNWEKKINNVLAPLLYGENTSMQIQSLILTRNYNILPLLFKKKTKNDKYFRLDDRSVITSKTFLLPTDENGVRVMALMFAERAKERLVDITVQAEKRVGNKQFTYDYLDGDRYTCVLLYPDVMNLKRFLRGIAPYHDLRGRIHVYDFQEAAVLQIAKEVKNDIEIIVWSIEEVEQKLRGGDVK